MRPFTTFDGIVVPLARANIDTDAILPKQYLKSLSRTGFGPVLFDELRYFDAGTLETDPNTRKPNPQFALNQPRYRGASILLAGENFGCGSSREHAVWALYDYGFRALIAGSFADIFYGNCFKNGILPIRLSAALIDRLFEETHENDGFRIVVDLNSKTLMTSTGRRIHFDLDEQRRTALIRGIDEIGETLLKEAKIAAYEAVRRQSEPWIFLN